MHGPAVAAGSTELHSSPSMQAACGPHFRRLPAVSFWGVLPGGHVGSAESAGVPHEGRQKAGIVGSEREGVQCVSERELQEGGGRGRGSRLMWVVPAAQGRQGSRWPHDVSARILVTQTHPARCDCREAACRGQQKRREVISG